MYDLKTFQFGKGSHATREDGLCVMEAVAMLAGEPHTDTPKCASVVITKLAIWVNDSCSDKLRNELLRDLPWRIVGTKASEAIEQQRAYMAADWAVRFVCPIMLRRAGLEAEASKLESLSVIDSPAAANAATYATYSAAYSATNAAAKAAASAADAADAAAYATYATTYATNAATYATNAATNATYAATNATNAATNATNAATNATYAATYAAANATNAANAGNDLEIIQRSCVQLIDRMIRLTEPQEGAPAIGAQKLLNVSK